MLGLNISGVDKTTVDSATEAVGGTFTVESTEGVMSDISGN